MILFYSCAQQKELPHSKIGKNTRILFTAWNEDTLNSYHIVAFSNKTFYYGIRKLDSAGNEFKKVYVGKIKYETDNVYLKFKGVNPDLDLNPILMVEASGTYLIQTFNSGNLRLFLRLNYNHHRRYKYSREN